MKMDLESPATPYDLLEDKLLSLENLNLKGDDIQKLSVIQNLPQLIQIEPQATYARVIPKILQELPNSSCEFHVMTSKVFRTLVEKQVPVNLLHAVLQGIESKDAIVANSWMETLLVLIPNLAESQIKNEIIPLASCKSLLTQPVSSRIASCRILGKLAVHKNLDPLDVKRDILPVVQSLCQDVNYDVRTAMCIQLPHVGQGLGSILLRTTLLTSIVELASDDNTYVKSAAITSIVQIFPFTTLETKKATILPLVKQLCEKGLRAEDITAATISREMGKLVEGLQLVLNSYDYIWFLNCYKTLARRGLSTDPSDHRSPDASLDVICRQHCAANLPSMSTFTLTVSPNHIETFYTIFRELAADPCYMIRKTVAGNIHDVLRIFGSQCKMLKPDLVRLLRDDSEDVLQMLVPHIGVCLENLSVHNTLSRQVSSVATVEIGRAILKCQYELNNGFNWRLLTHFIHQLEHLPNCMPPDFIHQHFTPVVLNFAVQGRAKPVRNQAVRTLLIFLRYNGKEMQRRWLKENLISQLCYSKSCYTRHIFIRLCINALEIFSERYFKDNFYDNLLDLANDPVANIRYSVANMFLTLRQMLVLPDDQVLYDRLNETFQRYNSLEKDRDVLDVYRKKMEELKRPTPAAAKEEHEKEQKKKLEEEMKILANLKGGSLIMKKPVVVKQQSRPGSISKIAVIRDNAANKTGSGSQRSVSLPPKSTQPVGQTSDMSFLEQHFYIDAGVNLPTKQLQKPPDIGKSTKRIATDKLSTVSHATEQEGECKQMLSSNITDDDKVNLRKLERKNLNKTIPSKNKRHSSVFSTTCLKKEQEKKVLNRLSLNITAKETSKIPVTVGYNRSCTNNKKNHKQEAIHGTKSSEKNVDIQTCDNNEDYSLENKNEDVDISIIDKNEVNNLNINNNNSPKLVSHLPVLTRRSLSESRKAPGN